MVKHIVFWNVSASDKATKEENMNHIKEILLALPKHIKEINEIEVGFDFNGSPAAFDVALYSTFDSKAGLEAYQVHPEHVKVAEFVKSVATARAVVDYEL